jgi:hypothetical protein
MLDNFVEFTLSVSYQRDLTTFLATRKLEIKELGIYYICI